MGSKFSQISGVVLCCNKFLAIFFCLVPLDRFRTLLFDYIPALLINRSIFHITNTIYVLTNSQIFTNKKTTCTWIVLVGISKIQVWSTQLFGQVDRQVVTLHCSNSRAGKNLRGVHCTMSQTLQKKCIFHTFWYSYECNRLKSACGVKKNFRKYDLWDESVYHFQTPWLLVPNCQCTHIISFLALCAIQPWDWTADPPF